MKLIFMGTPEFAVPSLDAVLAAGHTVAAVFTQSDKPAGRGQKLTPPPVKIRALESGLPVYQPESVRDEAVQQQIKDIAADCIIVAAYGKILPQAVLEAAPLGCVNVHSSLLPAYRGAAPINWAVINGDSRTGVTTMRLAAGVDTGDILLQDGTDILPDETAGELHDRLAQMGAKLLVRTLELAEKGELQPIKQDDSLATSAPKLDKAMGEIDWTLPAQCIHDLVRGLQPWPAAYTVLDGKRLKIHRTGLGGEFEGRPGSVVMLEPLTVVCGSGSIRILEIQAEGGKRMAASDYFRGHPLSADAVLG